MSDFGSLLSQLKSTAKQLPADNKRETPSDDTTSDRPDKRPRRQEFQDAATFPPVEEVYCICPAGVQTGGPEALHQLCHEINRCTTQQHSVRAYMLYVKSTGKGVVHASRAQKPLAYIDLYDAPVAKDVNPLVDSSPTSLLIWPECWTDAVLEYLDTCKNPCPCAIWWLSVDNNTGKFQEWGRNDILHLYQSEYARRFITNKGAKHVYRMTEYISLAPDKSTESSKRGTDVLYNPLKGMHYMDAIKKRSGSVMNIQPIGKGPDGRERVTPEQVGELLKSAKLYVDFGPHPGMDRLPREAALAGCCVVTNREGAAQFDEDVPLLARYKVREFNADAIHKLLKDLLDNFEERSKDFDEYRQWIRGQKERMKTCVSSFLDEVVEKRKRNHAVVIS